MSKETYTLSKETSHVQRDLHICRKRPVSRTTSKFEAVRYSSDVRRHACIQTYKHTHKHIRTHAHTYVHTHQHTHIHSYTHSFDNVKRDLHILSKETSSLSKETYINRKRAITM